MANTCRCLNAKGEPCQAPELAGSGYCFWHHPDQAAKRAEARRKGGLSSQYGPGGPERVEVSIRQVGDALGLLEAAAADLLARKPSVQRARALAYVCSIAIKAVELVSLGERLADLENQLKARVS